MKRKKLALIGAHGMLAKMVKAVVPSDFDLIPFDLSNFDITNRETVLSTLSHLAPQVIVNCAGFTDVDGCETNEAQAMNVNGKGPGYLAEAAKDIGATLVHISTDYVFSGDKTTPYLEEDATGPLSVYGQSKLAGEKSILASGLTHYFILRTSWLYGPGGKNFVETILRLAETREALQIVADQQGSPTYTEDLAKAIFSLLGSNAAYGTYHISNSGSCSWYEFAEAILKLARENKLQVKAMRIMPIRTEDFPRPAKRPAYSIFSKQKYETMTGQVLPDWRESLIRYFTIRQTR
jgi:dTDP-4-dehydrorhamnose reductase